MQIDESLKPVYAGFLIEEPEPFQAALRMFNGNENQVGMALWVAQNWQHDPVVVSEMKRLIDSGEAEESLPGKTDLLRQVWKWTTGESRMEDKLKAARLYAEMRDYLPKQGASQQVAVTVAPTVMVVRDFGSDADWEKQLKQQQDELIQANNAPVKH